MFTENVIFSECTFGIQIFVAQNVEIHQAFFYPDDTDTHTLVNTPPFFQVEIGSLSRSCFFFALLFCSLFPSAFKKLDVPWFFFRSTYIPPTTRLLHSRAESLHILVPSKLKVFFTSIHLNRDFSVENLVDELLEFSGETPFPVHFDSWKSPVSL